MVGAEVRAHHSDYVGQEIYISENASPVVLLARSPICTTGRVRRAVRRAGALCLLDPALYPMFQEEAVNLCER
jgi:hypothetical protein